MAEIGGVEEMDDYFKYDKFLPTEDLIIITHKEFLPLLDIVEKLTDYKETIQKIRERITNLLPKEDLK